MIKHTELGRIPVDAGDVVCISQDRLLELAEGFGLEPDALKEMTGGVNCGLNADGNFGVDRLTVVDVEGRTYPVVMVGGEPEKFLRFLGAGEPTFREFYDAHPRKPEVGRGDGYNAEVFNEIAQEYRKKLLEKAQ